MKATNRDRSMNYRLSLRPWATYCAAWLTVNACPAMVIVPVRAAPVEFAATLKATVPFPLPLAPLVTVTQLTPLIAVQEQPLPVAVTAIEPEPPAASIA